LGNLRIVASFLSKDQEYQRMQAADAEAAAARGGFDIEILFAEQNAILQIHQLFKYVHAPAAERPFAIVVETVVGEGLERVAKNAVRAGTGWALLNRRVGYLDALRREYPNIPVCAVSGDQLEAGRIQGRQFKALLPSGGSVLYIQGPADTSAGKERLQGCREVIEGSPIELRILEGSWTEESAEKVVTNMFRLKSAEAFRPDLVGSQNDAMAVGARKALTAIREEWARLPYTGCDGLPEGGQRLVQTKQLAATIVSPSNSGPAIDLLARWVRNKEVLPLMLTQTPVSYPRIEELARRPGPP
jgi:ABC-type sugar transport system substrate-binding protein